MISHRGWPSRDDYDRALARELRARDVGLVCLAGFMRLVGAPLIDAFPNAILNIHPSLLPAFPGVDAQRQAIEHGVKISGVTVHLVTAELDGGPIILQRSVAGPRRRHAPRPWPRGSSRRSIAPIRTPFSSCWRVAGRSTAGASSEPRRACFSVTIATSGGQLIRTGT